MKAIKIYLVSLFMVVLISGLASLAYSQGGCNPTSDSLVLVNLYQSTNGPFWSNNENWLEEGIPVGQWFGVITNTAGCVTELVLRSNNLIGPLFADLSELQRLRKLDLRFNELYGNLPAGILNLPALDTLMLAGNELSGNLPTNLRDNSPLRYLSLGGNDFSGRIPAELGRFSNLEYLGLGSNDFSPPFPDEIYDLSNLKTLSVSSIGFYPLSSKITQLTNLEHLFASSINMWSVPAYIFDLGKLKTLSISQNNLLSFPWNLLSQVPDLEILSLSDNYQLSGSIGPELYQLQNLRNFSVRDCNLSGTISPALGNLINLEVLILENNNFDGQFPEEIGNLSKLEWLWIRNNNFEGPIPPSIGNCTNLIWLYMARNQFSGPIPPSLGNLINLRQFQLNNNNLSGEIPADLANLVNSELESILLQNNNLSGCLPEELKVLCGKINLTIGGNPALPWSGNFSWFCAEIEQIGAFCNDGDANTSNDRIREDCSCRGDLCIPSADSLILTEFFLSTNGFEWLNNTHWLDTLVPFSNWHGITTNTEGCVINIQLASNNLQGNIPENFNDLLFLRILNLQNNQIHGPLPDSLTKLTQLTNLNLSQNQLSGEVPLDIFQLPKLNTLSLQFNQFSSLPDGNYSAPELGIIWLGNNLLEGNIPAGFGNMSKLFDLRLSTNQLSGNIPADLFSNCNFLIFWLDNNQLEGSIPYEMSNCRELISLWLNNNQLSGELPEFFGNFPLQQLFVQNNNLSGCLPDSLYNLCSVMQVNLSNNPALPWQGNFTRFCTGESQLGAFCDDGNPQTINDSIGPDCLCLGEFITYALNLISIPEEGGLTNGTGNYPGDAEITISAEANEGYRFVYWMSENEDFITDDQTFSLIMPFGDTTLYALFEKLTSVAEQINLDISVYPNPANKEITIEWTDALPNYDITIFSMDGRVLIKKKVNRNEKVTLHLPLEQGIYILEVSVDNQSVWRDRLMITR